MNLYIKQHIFTWGDRFTVKDDSGADRYFVEGEVFTFGKKLHVYDAFQNEAAYIEQKLFTWKPRYAIHLGNGQSVQLVREFSFFSPRYCLEGAGWIIEGDFMQHEYEIRCSGRLIATISKHWMTWGDSYEVNIADPEDELLVLSTVLGIDAVTDNQD